MSVIERIPIVLAVDVEPDDRLIDRRATPSWSGFERLHGHLSTLRERIASRPGGQPRFSWFLRMDPQVAEAYGDAAWGAERYAEQIGAIRKAQDVLGLHVHAFRWDERRENWIADHGDHRWVEHCVRVSAEAFQRSFHDVCRAYRMGDRYLDGSVVAVMESLGGRVDLSLEPGYGPVAAVYTAQPHTGSLPDLRDVPRRPYRPSRADFRRPAEDGEGAIALLPMSTWRMSFPVVIARRLYVATMLARKGPIPEVIKRDRMITAGLSLPSFIFRRLVEDLLAAPMPYLATIDRAHVGNQPAKLRRIERNLRYLLAHPRSSRFAFVGPEGLIELRGESIPPPIRC